MTSIGLDIAPIPRRNDGLETKEFSCTTIMMKRALLTEMRLDIEELSARHGILDKFEKERLPPIERRCYLTPCTRERRSFPTTESVALLLFSDIVDCSELVSD